MPTLETALHTLHQNARHTGHAAAERAIQNLWGGYSGLQAKQTATTFLQQLEDADPSVQAPPLFFNHWNRETFEQEFAVPHDDLELAITQWEITATNSYYTTLTDSATSLLTRS